MNFNLMTFMSFMLMAPATGDTRNIKIPIIIAIIALILIIISVVLSSNSRKNKK